MSINSYIDSADQKPQILVSYKGTPIANVLSVRRDNSYDQQSQNCEVIVGSYFPVSPNDFDLVQVWEGYNGNLVQTFTGYVDDAKKGLYPGTWSIVCRDVMKRAIDTWLDDEGKTYTNQSAESAVTDLLSYAGLSNTDIGSTGFTLATVKSAEFKLISVMEAINQIATLVDFRCWADATGKVFFQKQKPVPSSTTTTWTYTKGQNILESDFTFSDRNVRNRIIVMGYGTIRSAIHSTSPFVSSPPTYRTSVHSSELIDTQGIADGIALRMLTDLNTSTEDIRMKVVGNPLLDVGRTIYYDDTARGVKGNFFVFSTRFEHNGERGTYTLDMDVIRHEGSSDPIVEPPPPPPPTGCCTHPDLTRTMETQTACIGLGGIYAGDGVGCSGGPCGNPGGIDACDWRHLEYLATAAKGIFYSDDFTGPSGAMPTWTAVNTGLPDLNVRMLTADPFSPSTTQYCIVDDGNNDGHNAIYRRQGGSWSLLLDKTSANTVFTAAGIPLDVTKGLIQLIIPDIHRQGYLAAIVAGNVGYAIGWWWLESFDYGSTWAVKMNANETYGQIASTAFNMATNGGIVGFFRGSSAFGAGQVCYGMVYRAGTGGGPILAVSTDGASSWNSQAMGDYGNGTNRVPIWQIDLFQDVLYVGVGSGMTKSPGLWRSEDRGTTFTQIFSTDPFDARAGNLLTDGYKISPLYDSLNELGIAQVLRILPTAVVGDNADIFKSIDSGFTWLQYTHDPVLNIRSAGPHAVNLGITVVGDADNKIYGIATDVGVSNDPSIWVSEDEGQTWTDKSGTDKSSTTTTGIPGNCGGVVSILPVYA